MQTRNAGVSVERTLHYAYVTLIANVLIKPMNSVKLEGSV